MWPLSPSLLTYDMNDSTGQTGFEFRLRDINELIFMKSLARRKYSVNTYISLLISKNKVLYRCVSTEVRCIYRVIQGPLGPPGVPGGRGDSDNGIVIFIMNFAFIS